MTSSPSGLPGGDGRGEGGGFPVGGSALFALTVMFAITVVAVTVLSVLRTGDNTVVVAAIMGALATVSAGIIGIIKQGQETHQQLNGRLTELVESERGRARAETAIRIHTQQGTVPTPHEDDTTE